jgi:hypothetical protein
MNTHFREPDKLVFTEYCLFECTSNDSNRRYSNANLLLMIDVPSHQTVERFGRIELLLVPSHLQHIAFLDSNDRSTYPTKDQLIEDGWKVVSISFAPIRDEPVGGNRLTRRKQYSLRHIGAGTIDSVQGATIWSLFVFECSLRNRPWMKSQIVVLLSRVLAASQIIVIGNKRSAIDHMWQLICTPTQWTKYMERKLHLLSINSDGPAPELRHLNIATDFPFRICDYVLPKARTGYVYCLCSTKNPNYTYIGQCMDLEKRIKQHQSGNGAEGTSDPSLLPFHIAGFISGFEEYDRSFLQQLETRWNNYRLRSDSRPSVMNVVQLGSKIAQDENAINISLRRLTMLNFTQLVEF